MYEMIFGKCGFKIWFVGKNEDDIWVWNLKNQTGLTGDVKSFCVFGGGGVVQTKGPWCSNRTDLKADTGFEFKNRNQMVTL